MLLHGCPQASSRASKETGMEQLQKQWGAPELSYIEPVFRPPAEAGSLILQVTNGCSWNKCTFCEMYTSEAKKFRLKPLEVLEHEITLIARMGGGIEALNRVFLGDGDAMMLPFDRLVAILGLINKHMPWVKRISSYCLPRNIRTKTVEQLNQLKAMGLTTLYVGCESGDNEVLSRIQKGETFASSLDALNKIHAAGLKSSVMILTGLGGSELSEQHALNSALLVSSANPTYLSTLILTFPMGKERFVQNFTGFTELSPLELLAENRKFIEATDLKKTIFRSDHASNYLPLAGNSFSVSVCQKYVLCCFLCIFLSRSCPSDVRVVSVFVNTGVLGKDKTRLLREVDSISFHPHLAHAFNLLLLLPRNVWAPVFTALRFSCMNFDSCFHQRL